MSQPPGNSAESVAYPPGVVQRTVINGEMPALVVVHDNEGDWLIGDGVNDPNEKGACAIVHIGHIIDLDPSLSDVLTLPLGYSASRDSGSSPWQVSRWEYDE